VVILVGVLVLVLGAVVGWLYLDARRSLPELAGARRVPGLSAPVEIVRDADAIPHIYAKSRADALYGLGYVHAQDRLWQMELHRRAAQGRLAELLGSLALANDRYMRTLGMPQAARSAWESMPAEPRALVEAYLAGVNAFIASGGERSPEWTLLSVEPEPWTGSDVVLLIKFLAWDLNSTYLDELMRADFVERLGAQRAAQLMPPYPQGGPTALSTWEGQPSAPAPTPAPVAPPDGRQGRAIPRLRALDSQLRELLGLSPEGRRSVGSNSWVVGGARTTTGKPLLANDPHFEASLPSFWYLAHVSGGELDVIGASLPGVPCVVIGRNRSIAWGVTNGQPDVQDLAWERLDPTGTQAEHQERMEPLQVRMETLKVRWGSDVQYPVRSTRNGPLITDAITPEEAEREEPRREKPYAPLSMRWTALGPRDETVRALLELNVAKNWNEFRAALSHFVAPVQNVLYADVEGNIGYTFAGHIPIRSSGRGLVPSEGWTGTEQWTGLIPFDELPHAFNPPSHFIVSANNPPVPANFPYYLGDAFEAPHRAQRITTLLQAREKLSPDDLVTIQGDTVSLLAEALLPGFLARAQPGSERERAAIALLSGWNRDVKGDSPAAAIFEAWYQRLVSVLVEDELGPRLYDEYDGNFQVVSLFLADALRDPQSPWCDDVKTPEKEDCATTEMRALRQGLDKLEARLGPDMRAWRWDGVHIIAFVHRPFGDVPLLDDVFSRKVPNGSDWSTVNLGTFNMKSFRQRIIPGYRQIADLSSPTAGRFIMAGGQSGHVLSPHYDDYLSPWKALSLLPMRFDRAEVEPGQRGTLRLEP
jgi:penicillin amidase